MSSRSYRIGVESGLRWAYLAMTSMFAISWVVVGVAHRDQMGPGLWAAVTAFVLLTLVVGWRGTQLRQTNVDIAAMTLVAVWLQVACVTDPQAPFGPGQRTMVTAAVVLGAFIFTSRGWRVAAVATGVVAQVVVDWVRLDAFDALGGLWPVLAAGIAVAVCIPVIREAARRADTAADDQQRLSAQTAAQVAVHQAHLDIQGVLHDDVVSALRAVSLPEVSQIEARHAAQGAVAAIERSPESVDDHIPRDLAQFIHDLDPVPGTITTIHPGEAIIVPGVVAIAAMTATGELLRNVARHAHASHVDVVLDRDRDGFALMIKDDGAGFRPTEDMARSHGLRNSVVGRLQDVGGRAEITSAPGRGTSARLTWQPAATSPLHEPNRSERIAAALEDVRPPLAAVCLPYLAMTGVFAVRYHVDDRLPWWLLAWFVGLCAITLALLARANNGLSGPVVAASLGYGVSGTIASLFVLAPGSLHDYSSWPLGAITPLLAVVVIVRPPWEAAAGLLVQQVAITAAALAGNFGAGSWSAQVAAITPAATSTVQPVVLGLVLGHTILRLGDVVTHANAARSASADIDSAFRARESIHQRRLADLDEEILPFLRGVANDEVSLSSQGIRERARMLERGARDELHIPGVLDATTRDLLRRARDSGCVITIQSGIADIPFGDLVRDILAAALASGGAPRELVLSIQHSENATKINLVTVPGDPGRAAALSKAFPHLLSVDSTPEATWAELTLPERSLAQGQTTA